MSIVKFEVGQKYENMKGVYEVLLVEGNAMRIRWESGEDPPSRRFRQPCQEVSEDLQLLGDCPW